MLDQTKMLTALDSRLFGGPGEGIITPAIHLRIDLFRLKQSAATIIIETLGTPALLAQAR